MFDFYVWTFMQYGCLSILLCVVVISLLYGLLFSYALVFMYRLLSTRIRKGGFISDVQVLARE